MLVNRTCSETSETESLVHPAGVVVTVMTHDGTARPVLSMSAASVSQHLAKLRMTQLGPGTKARAYALRHKPFGSPERADPRSGRAQRTFPATPSERDTFTLICKSALTHENARVAVFVASLGVTRVRRVDQK